VQGNGVSSVRARVGPVTICGAEARGRAEADPGRSFAGASRVCHPLCHRVTDICDFVTFTI